MSDSSATRFRLVLLTIAALATSTSSAFGQFYEVYYAPDCAIELTAWLPTMPGDCASCCISPADGCQPAAPMADCCQPAAPMVACAAAPMVGGCAVTAGYPALAPLAIGPPGAVVAPPGQLMQQGQPMQPPGQPGQQGESDTAPQGDKPSLPPAGQPQDPNGEPIMIDPDKEVDRPAGSGSEKTVVDRTTRLVPVAPRRQANLPASWRQARR